MSIANLKFRIKTSGTHLPVKGMLSANVEIRSAPAVARRHPRDFTFYLGNPFPRFLLSLLNLPGTLVTSFVFIRVHSWLKGTSLTATFEPQISEMWGKALIQKRQHGITREWH